MASDKNTGRLLGAAFLFVLVAAAISGSATLETRIWSGSISDNLVKISDSLTLMRINILGELITSIGIVVLAVLLYVILHKQNRIIALVALGWWLAEAITLAVSRMPVFSLLNVSQEFVKAGAPDSSHFQTLGNLYFEAADFGYDIHMLFFCLGGILWYYLLYKSRVIPRVLSLWGLVTVSIALIATLFAISGYKVPIFVYLLYGPFEPVVGVWLLIKGIRDGSETE